MTDPSHPEGQSPVQPTCEGCGLPRREGATDSGVPLCYVDWSGWRGREPSHVKDNCASRTIARLRAELAQQKQFGLDRLAQHVEEEQAAHAENAILRAQLSEKEAEIARLKDELAALRVERDEAVANLDAIKAKTRPMLDECIRNSEIAQQTVDAARAEVARIQAQWGADYERLTKAELLSAAERVTRRAAEARAEGAIAAQAKAEQERDEARAEAEGLREALRAATEPGAQSRPAERCKVLIPAMDGRPFAVNECGAPLPCAEHPTSKEGK